MIENNLFNRDVTLDANSDKVIFARNSTGGVVTDNSTNITEYGNWEFRRRGAARRKLLDPLVLTARESTPGNILQLNPNSGAGGSWGMESKSAGASADAYVKMRDVIIAGNTSGGALRVKSAVGGTTWATFTSGGLTMLSTPIRAHRPGGEHVTPVRFRLRCRRDDLRYDTR